MSEKKQEVLWLLAMTLCLAVFGVMAQCLGNDLEEGIYTHRIIRYWWEVLLICGGAMVVWKTLNVLSRRYPERFKYVLMLVLLLLFVFNIFVAVRMFSDFRLDGVNWSKGWKYRDTLRHSRLMGKGDNMEEILPDRFWRWESNAVLPALGLGYGLLAVFFYLWICWIWLFYAVRCVRHLRREIRLELCAGEEKLLGFDLTGAVYLSALLPVALRLIGQVMPLLGLGVSYGGILFFEREVSSLRVVPAEAGIVQLLTMAYLLSCPCVVKEEEKQKAELVSEMVMEG